MRTNSHGSPTRLTRLGSIALFLTAIALTAGGFITLRESRGSSAASARQTEDRLDDADVPFPIGPLVAPILPADSAEARAVAVLMEHPPLPAPAGPTFMHALRLCPKWASTQPGGLDRGQMIRILTDDDAAKSACGQALLVRTRYGLRFTLMANHEARDGESHRDVSLSTFAELGLPLSTPINAAGGRFTLRDLLRDSTQTFDLGAKEIAWTANALCLYLHARPYWTNRDGRRFTFDDLARELLSRRLDQESCAGTHLLMAMTSLLRVDEAEHNLTVETRAALRDRLESMVRQAEKSQGSDGSWTTSWHQGQQDHSSLAQSPTLKLVATGHVLEWMQYLPRELQPPASTMRSAAEWLCATLPAPSPPELVGPRFCPWTHGVCAVRNLIDTADSSARTDAR